MKQSLLLACCLLTVACSTTWGRSTEDYPGPHGGAREVSDWARAARVYKQVNTVALIDVTPINEQVHAFLSDVLARDAPGRDSADVLGFSLETTLATAIVIMEGQGDWETLDHWRSPWTVTLARGEQRWTASEIASMRATATFERFFPAWSPWVRVWRVQFPVARTALSPPVKIEFSAPENMQTTLRWR